MSLYRLIYSSQAVDTLQPADLQAILETSEKNNLADGITGLLCYGKPFFLQVLEGEWDKINETYHRIVRDDRHHTPRLIECTPIKRRNFEVWSMQAVTLDNLSKDQTKSLILKYSGSTALNPNGMDPEQCLNFMMDLAKVYQLSDNFFIDL